MDITSRRMGLWSKKHNFRILSCSIETSLTGTHRLTTSPSSIKCVNSSQTQAKEWLVGGKERRRSGELGKRRIKKTSEGGRCWRMQSLGLKDAVLDLVYHLLYTVCYSKYLLPMLTFCSIFTTIDLPPVHIISRNWDVVASTLYVVITFTFAVEHACYTVPEKLSYPIWLILPFWRYIVYICKIEFSNDDKYC